MAPKFSDQEDKTLIMCVNKYPYLYHTKSRNLNSEMKEAAWTAIAATVRRDASACKKRWRDIKDHYYKVRRRQTLLKTDRRRKCKWPLYGALSFLSKVYEEMHTVKIAQVKTQVEENNTRGNSKRKYAKHLHGHPISGTGSEVLVDSEKDSDSEKMSDITQETVKTEMDTSKQNDAWEMQALGQRVHETETQYYSSDAANITLVSSKYSSEDAEASVKEKFQMETVDDVDLFMKSIAIIMKQMPPERIAQAKLDILLLVSKLQFPSQFQSE